MYYKSKNIFILASFGVMMFILNTDINAGSVEFSQKFLSHFLENKTDENILFSGTSLRSALGIAALGADKNVLESMKKVLQFKDINNLKLNIPFSDKKGEIFQIANKLYVRKGLELNNAYVSKVASVFSPESLDSVIFNEATRKTINDWVSKNTNGKINEIIRDTLSTETLMIIVNALYINQEWLYPFNPNHNRDDKFYNSKQNTVKTTFMFLEEKLDYFEDANVQIVELPYKHDFVFQIMLPKEKIQLSSVLKKLPQKIKFSNVKVAASIPKFKFEWRNAQLTKDFSALGMKLAPFNQIFKSSNPNINSAEISVIIHQAMIEVAEKGTEAAAATVVEMLEGAMYDPTPVKVFKANRPFIFRIIHQKTNEAVFMGVLQKVDGKKVL